MLEERERAASLPSLSGIWRRSTRISAENEVDSREREAASVRRLVTFRTPLTLSAPPLDEEERKITTSTLARRNGDEGEEEEERER